MSLILPEKYQPTLTIRDTEAAIVFIRERFQEVLGQKLHLQRMSAPLFVEKDTGLNDNLNGIERPVAFDAKDLPKDDTVEIVHSLAKWKRMALKKYGFGIHEGLFTNMNAIRRDEDLDNFHSIYVDQWDWEKIIAKEERTEDTLKETVRKIFSAIKHVETECAERYPASTYRLPEDVHFVTTQELEDTWPDLSPEEREDKIAKKEKAVFIMKIGDKLKRSGQPHDGRAPDYDDWALNGDLIFWYEPLGQNLKFHQWASESVLKVSTSNWKKLTALTAKNCLSIVNYLKVNYLTPLVAELVNLVYVCSYLVKLILVRFRQVFGLAICSKSVKNIIFNFYN